MNKIYKVIWSKAKSCYIVVSELAKRASRSSTATKAGRMSLAAVMAVAALTAGTLSPSSALAADNEKVVFETASPGYYAAIAIDSGDANPFDDKAYGILSATPSGTTDTIYVPYGNSTTQLRNVPTYYTVVVQDPNDSTKTYSYKYNRTPVSVDDATY